MTSRELSAVAGILASASDWLLAVIEANPREVFELAANERIARAVRRRHVDNAPLAALHAITARNVADGGAIYGEELPTD